MAQNVQTFYNQNRNLFETFLQNLAYTLLFEDHKNVWIFQKCVHSTIVMCEGGASQGVLTSYKIILDVISQNEPNVERQIKLKKEVDTFMGPGGSGINGFPSHGLDYKSRDDF